MNLTQANQLDFSFTFQVSFEDAIVVGVEEKAATLIDCNIGTVCGFINKRFVRTGARHDIYAVLCRVVDVVRRYIHGNALKPGDPACHFCEA